MEDSRFIAIETKLLHQERLLEELHQALYQQQGVINKIQKKLKDLEELSQSENETSTAHEKPPHY